MKKLISSILWNLILITAGALIYSFGIKTIIVHHSFITGGVFGTSLLLNYTVSLLTPGLWYFILNIPLFIVGWVFVSRRFFWYSLYAMLVITLATELIHYNLNIGNQLYAAVAGGVITGAGTGTILRSLGSAGGLDVIAVVLHKNLGMGIGKFYFAYNAVLFLFTIVFLDIDLVIASLILVFISAVTVDYVLALFSQRKIVYIISNKNEAISRAILDKLRHGATVFKAKGAYSGEDRDVLMTITNNLQLKRLEEIVFSIDDSALFIVGQTLGVIGSTFSKRKVY
jgi:uncharacterized membrane-anchored protein YitT (DUF2179 family)